MNPQESTVYGHRQEVASGERFEFGKNWANFLREVNDEKIEMAEASLANMLGRKSLKGLRFIDVGSGSGLSSLSARRLGAEVLSFDYDPQSVNCTRTLRDRYFKDDPQWQVMSGSVLDKNFIASLGTFDIMLSWGVLHHTGHMWDALTNVVPLVRPGGSLYVAIYNDQGTPSRRWTSVKKLYNSTPSFLRWMVLLPCFAHLYWRPIVKDILALKPGRTFREYSKNRGMTVWWDLVDWVGGYPFEVAKPEEIFDFYRKYGFELRKMVTQAGSMGCNEFVFERVQAPAAKSGGA